MRRLLTPIFTAAFVAATLAGCGGGPNAPAPATAVTFDAKATRDGATSIKLEGAVWGEGPAAVVFAHDYPKTQDAWAMFAQRISARRFMALTFNFRGYGQSAGFKDPSGAVLDLEGAIEKARQLGAKRIILVGASMGGTAALIVASRMDVAAVVSVSAPESFRGLDATADVKGLRAPALFVAAEGDPAGAAEAARRLAGAAPEPKRLEIEQGSAAHGTDLLSTERVAAEIERFLVDHRD